MHLRLAWRLSGQAFAARLLGIFSGVILAYASVASLAPAKWNLRYPGGAKALLFSLGLAVLLCGIAARGAAQRRWYFLILWAAAIVVYLVWFYHPPMWT